MSKTEGDGITHFGRAQFSPPARERYVCGEFSPRTACVNPRGRSDDHPMRDSNRGRPLLAQPKADRDTLEHFPIPCSEPRASARAISRRLMRCECPWIRNTTSGNILNTYRAREIDPIVNLRWCRSLAVILIVAGSASIALGASNEAALDEPAPIVFGVAADGKALWLHDGRVYDSTSFVEHFAWRTTEPNAEGRRYNRGPRVGGRVSRVAVCAGELHVFFSDGSHWRYSPTIGTINRPALNKFVEARVPGSGPPIAVAADARNRFLLAMIGAAEAQTLRVPSAPQGQAGNEDSPAGGVGNDDRRDQALDEEPGASGENRTQTNEASGAAEGDAAGMTRPDGIDPEQPAGPTLEATSPFALVRYVEGRWVYDRLAPVDINAQPSDVRVFASGDLVHVVYKAGSHDGPLMFQSSVSPRDPWSDPVEMDLPRDARLFGSSWGGDGPMLLAAEPVAGGVRITPFNHAGGAWTRGTTLLDESGRDTVFDQACSGAFYLGHVAIVTVSPARRLLCGMWSLSDGRPVESPDVVRPLVAPSAPLIGEPTRLALELAALAVVFGAVFLVYRERMMSAAPVRKDERPARLSRRALAFGIDAVILLPVLWRHYIYVVNPTLQDQVERYALGESMIPPELFHYWERAIIGAVFALYATLFEGTMGTTPGKRIMGCKIVCEGDGQLGFKRAALRNVLRIVEFSLVPLVILVAFTRSRQRLGDLVARCVVVEPFPLLFDETLPATDGTDADGPDAAPDETKDDDDQRPHDETDKADSDEETPDKA